MLDRVNTQIKEAMKSQDKARLSALRMLKSTLLENKTSKAPKPEADVAIAHVKKLRDSLASFPEESNCRI